MPSNTVLSHTNLPFQQTQDLKDVPLKTFATHVRDFLNQSKNTPETDVLKFYFLNHAFLTISSKYSPLEPLPKPLEDLLEYRTRAIPAICSRVLCHTFLTLLYEMNWLHPEVSENDRFYVDMEHRFGRDLAQHMTQGGGGGFSLGRMGNFDKLNTTCGEYVRALFNVYTTSNHFHAIAKDKQWIAIATVPYEFFMGQTSPEGVCDKAFSLFHWGGSIFNKNILYKVNTNEMMHLLDVQDSGQIPNWLRENKKSRFVDKDLEKIFQAFESYFPEEVKAPVSKEKIAQAQKLRDQKLAKMINQRGNGQNQNWAQQQAQQKNQPPPVQRIDQIMVDTMTKMGKVF